MSTAVIVAPGADTISVRASGLSHLHPVAQGAAAPVRRLPDRRLLDAVRHGDQNAVRALIKAGVDVNARAADGASALHIAVALDDAHMTRLLLQAGAAVNATNDLGVTPLFLASSGGDASLMASLLDAGADPTVANATGVTPLMMASRSGNLIAVKSLLARGVSVHARERTRDQDALMWAVVHRQAQVLQTLIDAGADVHTRSRTSRQYVLACCQEYNNDTGVPMHVDFGGYTALMYAAQQGDVESAKRLLTAGARAEDRAADGTTPLVIASFAGHGAFAVFLLDQGADPDADGAGYTALHVAVLRDDEALVRALLARRPNLNARLKKATFYRFGAPDYAFNQRWLGATPFWLAVAFHDIELMKILIAGGADPDAPRDDGTSPLIAAIGPKRNIDWRPEVRRAFSETGNPLPPGSEHERSVLETAKFLATVTASINAANGDGDTALHRAAEKRYVTVVKFLAEHGARHDIRNKQGLSPLAVALAERPYPSGASDAEAFRKAYADIDAPRDQLVALLRGFGARE